MTDSHNTPEHNDNSAAAPSDTAPASVWSVAVNILTSPGEAFQALEKNPSKLFPLALILVSSVAVMLWYFTIIDFSWYIDDTLSLQSNLSAEQLQNARDAMSSMSQTTFKIFGVLGSTAGILVVYLLQSAYLSLTSALIGDKYRFSHWFSLVCWTNLPYLLAVLGMVVTILMSPNGQISAYDLNPLTLANLGVSSGNPSLQTLLSALNLTMIWNVSLLVMGYRQWLSASWSKAVGVVVTPYVLIFGIWTYFALT